jgi:hypothetical protein
LVVVVVCPLTPLLAVTKTVALVVVVLVMVV